jgi:hypothetical protein
LTFEVLVRFLVDHVTHAVLKLFLVVGLKSFRFLVVGRERVASTPTGETVLTDCSRTHTVAVESKAE